MEDAFKSKVLEKYSQIILKTKSEDETNLLAADYIKSDVGTKVVLNQWQIILTKFLRRYVEEF